MIKFLKNKRGIAVTLFPIMVLPVIYISVLVTEPIIDVGINKGSISMEYDHNIVVTPPAEKENPDEEIPIVKYEGYDTFGELRIPAINLNQKVISSVTADADAIEISSAYLYSTDGFNRPGNTVIIGHNYRNGELFSNVTKLKIGDKIYLKTNGQDEIEYTIYKIFETSSSDASFYNRDTQGKREITLSTCTDDVEVTDNRLIILGKEE